MPVTLPPTLPQNAEEALGSYRFWVEMTSVVEAMFTECSGLSMEMDSPLEYKEGGVNDHLIILPSRTKYPRIVLKRGFILSPKLYDWYQKGIKSLLVERISFSIILYDQALNRVKTWDVLDAFPVKWVGPELKTDGSTQVVESIEIMHHGLTMRTEEPK